MSSKVLAAYPHPDNPAATVRFLAASAKAANGAWCRECGRVFCDETARYWSWRTALGLHHEGTGHTVDYITIWLEPLPADARNPLVTPTTPVTPEP